MKAKTNKIISFVLTVILLAVAVLVFLPKAFGLTVYCVNSNSMSPTVKKGDLVFVKKVSFEEIKENDIITFSNSIKTKHCTHRVVSVYENKSFKTKGDGNNSPDPERVTFEAVEGKVVKKISLLGFLSLAFDNIYVKIAVAVLFIIYISVEIEIFKKRRRTKQ